MPAAGERQNPSVYYSGVSWALGLIAAINRRNFFADLLQLQADFYTGLFLKSYMSDYWLVINTSHPCTFLEISHCAMWAKQKPLCEVERWYWLLTVLHAKPLPVTKQVSTPTASPSQWICHTRKQRFSSPSLCSQYTHIVLWMEWSLNGGITQWSDRSTDPVFKFESCWVPTVRMSSSHNFQLLALQ